MLAQLKIHGFHLSMDSTATSETTLNPSPQPPHLRPSSLQAHWAKCPRFWPSFLEGLEGPQLPLETSPARVSNVDIATSINFQHVAIHTVTCDKNASFKKQPDPLFGGGVYH